MKLSRTNPSRGSKSAQVTGFYDDDTGSIQYLVADPDTRQAALIDTVLSFDPKSAATNSDSVEDILDFAKAEGLDITWILDTHPHADHLMASSFLKKTSVQAQCNRGQGSGHRRALARLLQHA